MNSSYLHSCVALLCAASLVACGGSSGSLSLGGTVSGLGTAGLVLSNGNSVSTVAPGASSFAFSDLINTDTDFDVQVKTQPVNAVCTVTNGKGKATTNSVLTVHVACITDSFELGGNITGLGGSNLVLANGSDVLVVAPPSNTFTFATKVGVGAPYGVSIKTQPADKTCIVVEPSGGGRMPAAKVDTVQVTCA